MYAADDVTMAASGEILPRDAADRAFASLPTVGDNFIASFLLPAWDLLFGATLSSGNNASTEVTESLTLLPTIENAEMPNNRTDAAFVAATLSNNAVAYNPEYTKTMGLIEAIFADDCVFHPTPENYVMIVAFCLIFCLSVVGNSVVVVVILQQRSMRSVTNLYLLNLALSDLLLSVVCMPPTLVSSLVYCWVFGDLLCKLLAYLQPVVVTASAYTLAAIALERYYAIVKPLHSRVWHTKSHALFVIGFVWLISIIANLFMLFMYELRTYNRNGLNCAPKYDASVHFAYQIYMTVMLLIVPLVIMTVLYGAVIRTLRFGIKMDIAAIDISAAVAANSESNEPNIENKSSSEPPGARGTISKQISNHTKLSYDSSMAACGSSPLPPHKHSFEAATPLNNVNAKCDANNNSTEANSKRAKFRVKKLTKASWYSIISIRRRNKPSYFFLPCSKISTIDKPKLADSSTLPQSNQSCFDEANNDGGNSGEERRRPIVWPSSTYGGGHATTTDLGVRSVRSTHSGRTALVKQRLIRMLIVIVIIFFCCWTPSYIWWLLLNAQDSFGTFNVWNSELNTFITVLTYISSCTNPITYCFLNSKFRNALFLSFGCKRLKRRTTLYAHGQRMYTGSGSGSGGAGLGGALSSMPQARRARAFNFSIVANRQISLASLADANDAINNGGDVLSEREFSSTISNENYSSEMTTTAAVDDGAAVAAKLHNNVSRRGLFNGLVTFEKTQSSLKTTPEVSKTRPHSLSRFDLLNRMRHAFARYDTPHFRYSNNSSGARSGFSSPSNDDAPPLSCSSNIPILQDKIFVDAHTVIDAMPVVDALQPAIKLAYRFSLDNMPLYRRNHYSSLQSLAAINSAASPGSSSAYFALSSSSIGAVERMSRESNI